MCPEAIRRVALAVPRGVCGAPADLHAQLILVIRHVVFDLQVHRCDWPTHVALPASKVKAPPIRDLAEGNSRDYMTCCTLHMHLYNPYPYNLIVFASTLFVIRHRHRYKSP